MGEVGIGPGTTLDVIVAAIEAGAKPGDVLTLTGADGCTQTVTLGDRVVLPSDPPPPLVS
jgi:hypothetical protein